VIAILIAIMVLEVKNVKDKLSIVAYTVAIPLAFIKPWISEGLYVFVALMRLV
jgi:hypothetical protein